MNANYPFDRRQGIHAATEADIPAIMELLKPYVDKLILLPKTKEQIQKELPLTSLYYSDNGVAGVANLIRYSEHLYEIRGLTVRETDQKKGYGEQLVSTLTRMAREIAPPGPVRVFALTYVPLFFIKMGWEIVPKENFPKKIFDDCQFCKKKDDCREIAVTIEV